MKKKNLKTKIEKAFDVVNTFKTNAEILQKTEQDKELLKTLESSVKKLDKLEKEIDTLKERLKAKKTTLEQHRDITSEYIKTAKRILKTEAANNPTLFKKVKPSKKQKKEKPSTEEK